MKNIEAIMADFGVEIPEDKKADFLKAVNENYKTVSDWQNQKDKVTNLTDQLNTAKEELKKFDGVDANKLNEQIADLNKKLEEKDTEYQSQIADRDFQDIVNGAITEAKGLNPKAIKALLDMDTLKASKNQKDDVAKAIKTLSEQEDAKMLFGGDEPDVLGIGSPIGKVGKVGTPDNMASMRSIMGLPPINENK